MSGHDEKRIDRGSEETGNPRVRTVDDIPVQDRIKYAAEKVIDPILRLWFTQIDERGYPWPEHDAENAAVDLSWALEEAGLLTSELPAPPTASLSGSPEERRDA